MSEQTNARTPATAGRLGADRTGRTLAVDDRWPESGIGAFSTGVLGRLDDRGIPLTRFSNAADAVPMQLPNMARPFLLTALLREDRHQPFYSPGFYVPIGWSGPRAVTVHDLQYLRRGPGESAARQQYFKNLVVPWLRRCEVVLTVSEESATEIQACIASGPDIVIVGDGVAQAFFHEGLSPSPTGRWAEPDAFKVICVGNWLPHKQVPKVLDAVELLGASLPVEVSLPPITGQGSRLAQQCSLERGPAVTVRVRDWIDTEELAEEIGRADLLVMLSTEEGFGLPPLEAQAVGTPALVAEFQGSRQRYGDDGVHFVPPDISASELADVLAELASNDDLRTSTVEPGRRNVADMTWDRVGDRVIAALGKVGML